MVLLQCSASRVGIFSLSLCLLLEDRDTAGLCSVKTYIFNFEAHKVENVKRKIPQQWWYITVTKYMKQIGNDLKGESMSGSEYDVFSTGLCPITRLSISSI